MFQTFPMVNKHLVQYKHVTAPSQHTIMCGDLNSNKKRELSLDNVYLDSQSKGEKASEGDGEGGERMRQRENKINFSSKLIDEN